MYEVMAYWETADQNLTSSEYELEFARTYKRIPKIEISSTLEQVQGNARLVRQVSAEEIRKLKEQPGKDLAVGGANLASTFMQLGLIDECQLFVHPVVLGSGTPMFPASGDPTKLQLLETHTFRSGVVYLRYRRTDGGGKQLPFPAGLAKPAQRALAGAGYTGLEQLTRVSEDEILKLHGMGPKALEQLRRALAEKGLSFGVSSGKQDR
jgi:dihydrofolate reductase